MVALQVGATGVVQGRLPHGWRVVACFDRETSIIKVTSPDTDSFSLDVDTFKLDEFSSTHKPAVGVLEDARLEAKYDAESGVLRYDTAEVPEFWLEVHVQQIMIMMSQEQREQTSATESHAQKVVGRPVWVREWNLEAFIALEAEGFVVLKSRDKIDVMNFEKCKEAQPSNEFRTAFFVETKDDEKLMLTTTWDPHFIGKIFLSFGDGHSYTSMAAWSFELNTQAKVRVLKQMAISHLEEINPANIRKGSRKGTFATVSFKKDELVLCEEGEDIVISNTLLKLRGEVWLDVSSAWGLTVHILMHGRPNWFPSLSRNASSAKKELARAKDKELMKLLMKRFPDEKVIDVFTAVLTNFYESNGISLLGKKACLLQFSADDSNVDCRLNEGCLLLIAKRDISAHEEILVARDNTLDEESVMDSLCEFFAATYIQARQRGRVDRAALFKHKQRIDTDTNSSAARDLGDAARRRRRRRKKKAGAERERSSVSLSEKSEAQCESALPPILEAETEALSAPPPAAVVVTLANAGAFNDAPLRSSATAVPESSMGGESTCVICFAHEKTHIAVPCGHFCACADCSALLKDCPVCREPLLMWTKVWR